MKERISRLKDFSVLLVFSVIITGSILVYTFPNQQEDHHKSLVTQNIKQAGLPFIFIDTQQEILIKAPIYSEFTLYPESSFQNPISSLTQICIRGRTSVNYQKKSYNLLFGTKVSFLGMKANSRWELHALFTDTTKLRVKLAIDYWNQIQQLEHTKLPESEYIILYLNNEFQGLYLLVEKVDNQLINNEEVNDFYSSFIIQAMGASTFDDPPGQWDQEWPAIADYNVVDKLIPELSNFISNSTDEEFFSSTDGVYRRFDKTNLINLYLFNSLIQHRDFWGNNYFLVKSIQQDTFYFLPWDFDSSFDQFFVFLHNDTMEFQIIPNILFSRLLSNHEFITDFKQRWDDLRNCEWSTTFLNMTLNKELKKIEKILPFEYEKWNYLQYLSKNSTLSTPYIWNYSLNDYIIKLREFVVNRTIFLDIQWITSH